MVTPILPVFTVRQSVALTGRNRTGPPCSVGRRTSHAPGPAADRPRGRPGRPPAALQTTAASKQNNTGPVLIKLSNTIHVNMLKQGITLVDTHGAL